MDKFKKLKELYGPGGNFYSGADLGTHTQAYLGTRGADSNFSRVSQRLVPVDAFDYGVDEEEEEEDMSEEHEDYIVADSRYKLSEILELLGEAPTIEMMPDPENMNLFTPQLQTKMLALARTQRTAGDYASEVGQEELLNFITKYIPFGDEVLGAFKALKNIVFDINRRANKLLAMEGEVENLLAAMRSNPRNVDEKTIKALEDIIKEIEELQAALYIDYADLAQGLIMIIPEEPAGGPANPVANTVMQSIEFMAGFGIEKLMRDTVQSFEGSESDDIETLLSKDAAFSKLRVVIQFLTALQFASNFALVFLGPAGWAATALSILGVDAVNPGKVFIKGIKALFVGALMQNKLLNATRNIDQVTDTAKVSNSEEMFSATEVPDESPPGKDSFLRKLFISYPGDDLKESSFDKALRTNTLSFLVEEDESIHERPKNVKLRLRGESDPKGFSSGVYEQMLDSRDEDEEEDDEDIAEFSGAGAVGGVAMKMGHEADGSRTSQEKLKKRYDYFRRSYGSKG